jgi:RHH-type proline utilization regulon transcriptional repressor/proline dehydrogenase/delta 1-pyrroline-5-carboxylate dehydrogenase
LIRYRESELDQVIAAVNATSYGLTLGIHSRIDAVINTIRQGVKVGNIYVNRNMIGAVVGVQPFGGTGLSPAPARKRAAPIICAVSSLNRRSQQIPRR